MPTEPELLAGIGDRLDAQTEMLGKLLERLTEIRVILQGEADKPAPEPCFCGNPECQPR